MNDGKGSMGDRSRGPLAIRWTVGDVAPDGFEALRWSLWGAVRVFGASARYAVCVNSVSVGEARTWTGHVPASIQWVASPPDALPAWLTAALGPSLAEGTAWKFAPVRLFPDCYELALDNDCILWEVPEAIDRWLADPRRESFVLAEDVRALFGQFRHMCGSEGRNSGIRGLPPYFDLERVLRRTIGHARAPLDSELDEQGLQVAALMASGPVHVVGVDEVSICSPFPPHCPGLGRCGAHFVGLNARDLPWEYGGRPASEWTRAHWRAHREAVAARVLSTDHAPAAAPAESLPVVPGRGP